LSLSWREFDGSCYCVAVRFSPDLIGTTQFYSTLLKRRLPNVLVWRTLRVRPT
jgi:hypothetical protein